MAVDSGPPSVAGVISSQTRWSLGWGPFWRWWGSWRVWPRCRVVAECPRRRSRRSERLAALMRLRHRCRGDCWLCCPPGCRLGWSDRWRRIPLALDLNEGERRREESWNERVHRYLYQLHYLHLSSRSPEGKVRGTFIFLRCHRKCLSLSLSPVFVTWDLVKKGFTRIIFESSLSIHL